LPFSFPYNLPDGWVTAHVNLDEDRLYTRIFSFKDITHECRYAVKNDKEYNAWCLDQNLIGNPDYDYMVRMFNLKEELPDFGTFDTPKGEVTLEEFLKQDYDGNSIPYDKILYIINNRDGYSKAEVQEAIWYYTMGDGNFEPETDRYMELVNAAEAYGNGYRPPCGGKLAIFAITKAAEKTPELQPCELGQPFIIEMPVPSWLCKVRGPVHPSPGHHGHKGWPSGVCKCKTIYSMTMKFLGDVNADTVKAYDKRGNLVGEFPIDSDGNFYVDTVVKPEMTFVIGDYEQSIHTSCSQPIGPGMKFGNILITDWDADIKDCDIRGSKWKGKDDDDDDDKYWKKKWKKHKHWKKWDDDDCDDDDD